ncbi:MAG TPA: sigma-54 dependent transcriptional regulator, partial [Candidatus Binataceae bacterium]|nr:sigma-54 dependent transcriptional regulator [Candidatus Binataceae bacterium]
MTEAELHSSSSGSERVLAGKATVLIADDDPAIRLVLRHRLEADGYRVDEAPDSQAALEALRTGRFEVALVDIIMPGMGGLEVLSTAKAEGIGTLIIVITAASTMNNAVEAMKRGAHDYLTKPFPNLDLVAAAVRRAVEVSNQAAKAAELDNFKENVAPKLAGGEIIGRSPAMQEVYKLVGRLVTNDATVLIYGESGTGKDLVARTIHFKSARSAAPFVAVNCSAIPHGLLESELFGHERGSFTGATERRAGKFETAENGTLFLDEIGDLPLELQPKLLRALQEREFNRVGGTDTLRLRARVIAATNQDLEAAVRAKRFREDLYFRLRVIPIHMPPLRDRREDVPELAEYFIAKAAREMDAKNTTLGPGAIAKLRAYDWPGNVRELETTVMRA